MKHLLLLVLLIVSASMYAQVPVREEPRHKTVLLNDYIRLIDVHLARRDTTQYHIHEMPSVIVFISKSKMGTQDMSGKGIPPGETSPGQTLFRDYAREPVTHRVYNDGDNVFHVMDIELEKRSPSDDSCTALQQSNVETTINEKLVRVYRFDINNGKGVNITKSSCAHLLICVSGAVKVPGFLLKTGDYFFFNPLTATTIENAQNESSTCVLLELK